jgi:hypothetical protein
MRLTFDHFSLTVNKDCSQFAAKQSHLFALKGRNRLWKLMNTGTPWEIKLTIEVQMTLNVAGILTIMSKNVFKKIK